VGIPVIQVQLIHTTGWTTKEVCLYGKEIFLSSKMSRLDVGPTQPPVEWVAGVKWLRWRWPFTSRAKFMSMWKYAPIPSFTFYLWQQNKINKINYHKPMSMFWKCSNCKCNMPWSTPCWIILVTGYHCTTSFPIMFIYKAGSVFYHLLDIFV
jgi:hypothetical protein